MMRAIVQPSPTSTSLTLTDVPIPTPTPNTDEHLIRVHAVSPCNGELLWPALFPPSENRTFIPCPDFAGTVVTAPANSPFQPGSEVYTRANYYRNGAGSEYTVADTHELALRAKNTTWTESAAIPLSSLTAWQALFFHSEVGDFGSANWKGKRIAVTAASGGVGAWIVQLAKLSGAFVIGTCGTDNVEFVKGLGADEVVDYRRSSLKEWVQGKEKVDLVIDCIGKKALEDAWWVVKDKGIVMSIFQPPKEVFPAGCEADNTRSIFFIMTPNGGHLEAITKLVEEGKCRGFVDSVWKLEEYEKAFERVQTGHARGKVIIEIS
ncbi:NAD(P)-binding protein [Aspergillus unguis]